MTKHLYLFLLIYHFYGFVAHIVILFEYVALDMILYHGTNTIVEHPEVRICGFHTLGLKAQKRIAQGNALGF